MLHASCVCKRNNARRWLTPTIFIVRLVKRYAKYITLPSNSKR